MVKELKLGVYNFTTALQFCANLSFLRILLRFLPFNLRVAKVTQK